MHFIVQRLTPPAARVGDDGGLEVAREDHVKGYFTEKDGAVVEARNKAAKNPGQQYAVFGVLSVFETGKPTYIEKQVNERGELIIKPEGA